MTNSPDWTKAAGLPPDELARCLEEDHDEVDDNPPATTEQLAALTPGRRRPGQRGKGKRPAKELLAVRVDPDVLAAWRRSGPGWQTRLGEVLRERAPTSDDAVPGRLDAAGARRTRVRPRRSPS